MGGPIQIADVIQILFKRIKLLIIVPILSAIIGLLISMYVLPPVYRVQTDLLVNQTVGTEQNLPVTTDVELSLRLMETYQFIMNSARVSELVLSKLDHPYSIKEMNGKILIETNPQTQIISIYVEDSDPETASHIANLYATTSQQEITNLMKMDNVLILTEAKPENYTSPDRPVPILFMIKSYLVGVGLALVYVALSAYFNIKIHTRKDVERYLDVPLLGTIGMVSIYKKGRRKRAGKLDDSTNVISYANTNSLDMEAFRALRINIQFQRAAKNLQSLLVTSSEKNEGKTVTARNLAIAMAMDNKKTVLIDADLRKAKGAENIQKRNDIGLTNYLSGFAELDQLIERTAVNNLFTIKSGPIPSNPTELLASLKMDRLLKELETEYDMIIIDSPPLVFADPALLATKVDGCVFISHAGKTRVNDAQQGLAQLKAVHATIIGAVLNDRKDRKRASGY